MRNTPGIMCAGRGSVWDLDSRAGHWIWQFIMYCVICPGLVSRQCILFPLSKNHRSNNMKLSSQFMAIWWTVEGLCVICTGLIFLSQYSWCYATLAAMSLMDRISDCCTAGLTAGYMVSCNFDLGCHGTWPVLPGSAPGQHHLELQSSDLKIKTFEHVLFCLKYSRNE